MVVITIVKWGYKPTYHVWGPHIVGDQPATRRGPVVPVGPASGSLSRSRQRFRRPAV